VPGIGKRTAERIVVELREKVGGAALDDEIVITRSDSPHRVARDGLVELGFSLVEADEALRDAVGETPEALIAEGLRAARGGSDGVIAVDPAGGGA
jgi:Holliday junction DNA helicase RuvA